jgi:prepilin-type N-terminal cleavage/methylation domain-containing protein
MHLLFQDKRKAFSLVEVTIAVAILSVVGTMVAHWFTLNSQYQKRVTELNEKDNVIRTILWEMHKDLKIARNVLYPRRTSLTSDTLKNLVSDSKLVFRNFDGDIVIYYFDEKTKEIIKEIIYIPTPGAPKNEKRVIGKGIDCVIFTNRNELNNLVGIYMEAGPAVQIDSVYLMNE